MQYRTRARFIGEALEGIGLTLIVMSTWPVSRRWLRDWGSLPAERNRVWPGDTLVPQDHTTYTRGIDIAVTGDAVWPWLAQFGLGRAGFYSYELLERAVGIPVRNVESIIDDLPRLKVGDQILLHPQAPGIPVARLKEGHHICFGSLERPDSPIEQPDPARSWSMYVEPAAGHSSRLLLRSCIEPLRAPTFLQRLANLLEEPLDFIMEQRMLRTIKRLAEAGGAPGTGHDG